MTQNNQNQNEPTKAEVQSTKLNIMPAPGKHDTEFSAEAAAEVFDPSEKTQNNNQSK